jgi:hypothetical protein
LLVWLRIGRKAGANRNARIGPDGKMREEMLIANHIHVYASTLESLLVDELFN